MFEFGPFGPRGPGVIDKLTEQLIANAAKDLGERLIQGKLTDVESETLRSAVFTNVERFVKDQYGAGQILRKYAEEWLARPETQATVAKACEEALPGILKQIVDTHATNIVRETLRSVSRTAATKAKKGSSK